MLFETLFVSFAKSFVYPISPYFTPVFLALITAEMCRCVLARGSEPTTNLRRTFDGGGRKRSITLLIFTYLLLSLCETLRPQKGVKSARLSA